jgi:hypothetical protein
VDYTSPNTRKSRDEVESKGEPELKDELESKDEPRAQAEEPRVEATSPSRSGRARSLRDEPELTSPSLRTS